MNNTPINVDINRELYISLKFVRNVVDHFQYGTEFMTAAVGNSIINTPKTTWLLDRRCKYRIHIVHTANFKKKITNSL